MIIFLFLLSTDINKLYEEGKYFEVIEQAENALKDTNLTLEDRVGIHIIIAFSYIALNKERLAKLEFIEALSLKPELELDPMLTSPKIIQVFKEAKELFIPKRLEKVKKRPQLYTILIPGLPQIKEKNKTGFIILGTNIVSIISWFFSYYQKNKYHNEYLNARSPQKIKNSYNVYTTWYQINLASIALFSTSYALSLILYLQQ